MVGTSSDVQTTKMLAIAARPPAENARRITAAGLQIIGAQPRSPNLVCQSFAFILAADRS